MKKNFLIRTILCIVFLFDFAVVYGQFPCSHYLSEELYRDPDSLNMRIYEQWYMLPDATIMWDVFPLTTDLWFSNRGVYVLGNPNNNAGEYVNRVEDYAQPYRADSTVTIAGISGYVFIYDYTLLGQTDKYYFELRDSTLENTLAQVEIPEFSANLNKHTPMYTELLFDRPVNVSGKFYAVLHTPDTGTVTMSGNDRHCTNVFATRESNAAPDMYPLGRRVQSTEWELIPETWCTYFEGHRGSEATDTTRMVYLFPILADSSFVDLNDTIADTTSSLQSLEVDKYTDIYPNPTNGQVKVECDFKIYSVAVFNSVGVRIKEVKPNTYQYVEDLGPYPTGTYLFKVRTAKGTTVRKVVKQ